MKSRKQTRAKLERRWNRTYDRALHLLTRRTYGPQRLPTRFVRIGEAYLELRVLERQLGRLVPPAAAD
jgi:hypothetical protein